MWTPGFSFRVGGVNQSEYFGRQGRGNACDRCVFSRRVRKLGSVRVAVGCVGQSHGACDRVR